MSGWKVQKKKNRQVKSRKKTKYLFCYSQDTLSLKKDTELCYCVFGTVLYSVLWCFKGPAYWNAMSSIFRAQLSSLPCYAGGRDRRWEAAWLIISLMQQVMNQRTQSLTRDKRWHNTDGDRGSKSMLTRELLQRWKGFPGEAALFQAFNNQGVGKWSWTATEWPLCNNLQIP